MAEIPKYSPQPTAPLWSPAQRGLHFVCFAPQSLNTKQITLNDLTFHKTAKMGKAEGSVDRDGREREGGGKEKKHRKKTDGKMRHGNDEWTSGDTRELMALLPGQPLDP